MREDALADARVHKRVHKPTKNVHPPSICYACEHVCATLYNTKYKYKYKCRNDIDIKTMCTLYLFLHIAALHYTTLRCTILHYTARPSIPTIAATTTITPTGKITKILAHSLNPHVSAYVSSTFTFSRISFRSTVSNTRRISRR